MLFSILAGVFHIHEATPKTKTFVAALAVFLGGWIVLLNNLAQGDQNIKDYLDCGITILGSLGGIFLRSGLCHIGAKITAIADFLQKFESGQPK